MLTPRRARVLSLTVPLLAAGALAAATPASAVIGGTTSNYGPWAVRMLIDGQPTCTGTAISSRWILSASHCFFEHADAVPDSRITFRVGNLDERKGTTVRPVHGSRKGASRADMMLIKVPSMKVRPARLATSGVRDGQRVRQYGWGATCTGDENACQSPVLKQSELEVVPPKNPRCDGFAVPGGTDFCMKTVSGIPAGGDSGGPVMTVGPHGKETLVGVFDASDREKTSGAADVPGQLTWIRSVVGGKALSA